jgi:hypothetical protein
MPPEIVARLNSEMVKAITAPEVRAKLEASDLAVIGGPPDQQAKLLRKASRVQDRQQGIKPQ